MGEVKKGGYHEKMELESEGCMKKVEFLECRIERIEKNWRCSYWSKNMARKEKGEKEMIRFVEYSSYGDRRKIGLVIEAFTRVKKNSSDVERVWLEVMQVIRELREVGYTKYTIKRALERMERKKGERV